MYDARGRDPPPDLLSRRPRCRPTRRERGPRVLGSLQRSSRPRISGSAGTWDSCEVVMTKQKTFKRRVRERMEKTGESYASARAALIGEEPAGRAPRDERAAVRARRRRDRDQRAAAADHRRRRGRGVHDASATRPTDFTHFHLSGWNPFQSDVVAAVERLRLTPDIHETGGAKTAEKALRERLEERVQIAWVEDYSVLAVAAVDDDTAKVYDRRLTTHPGGRARRAPRPDPQAEAPAARDRARRAGHRRRRPRGPRARARTARVNPPSPGMTLDGIARWADDLDKRLAEVPARQAPRRRAARHGRRDPRSGGGLLRRLQAEGLREAAPIST